MNATATPIALRTAGITLGAVAMLAAGALLAPSAHAGGSVYLATDTVAVGYGHLQPVAHHSGNHSGYRAHPPGRHDDGHHRGRRGGHHPGDRHHRAATNGFRTRFNDHGFRRGGYPFHSGYRAGGHGFHAYPRAYRGYGFYPRHRGFRVRPGRHHDRGRHYRH